MFPGPLPSCRLRVTVLIWARYTTYDFDLGYRFNEHLSADIGLPLYSTRTPFPIVSTADWRYTTILGAPYIDIRYDTKRNRTNITSILTGAAGVNEVKTYSNGRMTVDWFNHLDRNYQILTFDASFSPFLNFGAARELWTGRLCRGLMNWPDLTKPWAISGMEKSAGPSPSRRSTGWKALYTASPPWARRRSIAGWFHPTRSWVATVTYNRYWDAYFITGGDLTSTTGGGPSRITRDNGFGVYLTVSRWKNFTIEVGDTRSIRYRYDAPFIMLRYNFTGLLRNLTVGE